MGNYVSCTLSSPLGKQSRAVKVIFPTGEIKHFYEPVKAAELMMETPGFFLVNSRSLQIGRRFSALNADEDLEIANVYAMFPMKRLNSAATAADVAPLFLAAKRVAGGNVRVLPEPLPSAETAAPKLNLDDVQEISAPEFRHRLSMCRSKKPLLETIVEEPVSSR
ncbi:hypothetical protein NMG60_11006139 [Bertholletia excelsa]